MFQKTKHFTFPDGAKAGMPMKTKGIRVKAGMLCAPQRRGSPVGGSPTQIVVGKSGS
jgi:hypothetical protein